MGRQVPGVAAALILYMSEDSFNILAQVVTQSPSGVTGERFLTRGRGNMKTLLILRHAKSSWKDASLVDHDRPLNKRGKRDALRMGKFLQAQGLVPDRIISSTAKRARKTAKAVAKACHCRNEVELTSEFYHAGPGSYLAVLQNALDDDQRVMVIGHNPGMEALVSHLTGRMETMPTAAVAHIALPIEKWTELDYEVQGELLDLWCPKGIS